MSSAVYLIVVYNQIATNKCGCHIGELSKDVEPGDLEVVARVLRLARGVATTGIQLYIPCGSASASRQQYADLKVG